MSACAKAYPFGREQHACKRATLRRVGGGNRSRTGELHGLHVAARGRCTGSCTPTEQNGNTLLNANTPLGLKRWHLSSVNAIAQTSDFTLAHLPENMHYSVSQISKQGNYPMNAHLRLVTSCNVNRKVDPVLRRPTNADMRTREYLRPAEIEQLSGQPKTAAGAIAT